MNNSRDHGGNLAAGIARFGGAPETWIDLSTGINAQSYPVPDVAPRDWARLPEAAAFEALYGAAKSAFDWPHDIIGFHGAQGAIQAIPHLLPTGTADVLFPSYNEHAAQLARAGWDVREGFSDGDICVLVSPNNPDGRVFTAAEINNMAARYKLIVVDESFGDIAPTDCYAKGGAPLAPNVIVLKSFGKFFGLAGARIGFALAQGLFAESLREMAGPWPLSGPAISIATQAYADHAWQDATRVRLAKDAKKLDALAEAKGWKLVGGCNLFRTYETPDARAAQAALGGQQIWSRIFPYSDRWIRLGLPSTTDWPRVTRALA